MTHNKVKTYACVSGEQMQFMIDRRTYWGFSITKIDTDEASCLLSSIKRMHELNLIGGDFELSSKSITNIVNNQ